MNRVILMGYLGNAPELRQSETGSVLKLRLSTRETWLDKHTKQREERTEWHDVTVFGARAEGLSRVLVKGDYIGVEGALHTSSWEKDGVKRYRTEVIAHDITFTGKRSGTSEEGEARSGASSKSKPRAAQPVLDEMPF